MERNELRKNSRAETQRELEGERVVCVCRVEATGESWVLSGAKALDIHTHTLCACLCASANLQAYNIACILLGLCVVFVSRMYYIMKIESTGKRIELSMTGYTARPFPCETALHIHGTHRHYTAPASLNEHWRKWERKEIQ